MLTDRYLYHWAGEIAKDCMGIFPAAVKKLFGWKYRTPYQTGWNDCLLALSDKQAKIHEIFSKMSPDQLEKLDYLHDEGDVTFTFWSVEQGFQIALNCSDTFEWACADAEDLPLKHLDEVYDLVQKFPKWGSIVWVAHRRQEDPMKQILGDPEFQKAQEYYTQKILDGTRVPEDQT